MRTRQRLARLRQLAGLGRSKPRPKSSRPPQLECLEDRTQPSVVFGNAPGAPVQQVNDGGGPELTAVQVQLIFWGAGWDKLPQLVSDVRGAVNNMVSGPYTDLLSQDPYKGGRDTRIGRGSLRAQNLIIDDSSPGKVFSDSALQDVIDNHIDGPLPEPDETGGEQIFYVVVTPPGTTDGKKGDVGYHSSFDTGSSIDTDTAPYAWVGTFGTTEADQLDSVTTILSHELVEAVTDPRPGPSPAIRLTPGANGSEIGDVANPYVARVNGVMFQAYWSQKDRASVLPTGQKQDFSVDSAGVLTIKGNQLSVPTDQIILSRQGNELRVDLNGEAVQFPLASSFLVTGPLGENPVTAIDVEGGAGNDNLTVDFSNGNPIPSGGLNFVGGTGGGVNTLNLKGNAPGTTTYSPTGPHDGSISVGGTKITYKNLTPINDTTTATTVVFNNTGGSSAMTLAAGPVVNGFATSQLLSSTFELVNFANKSDVAINGLGANVSLAVDFSGGNPIPLGGLNFDGGNGRSNVVLKGGGSSGDVYQPGLSPGSGTVAVPGSDGQLRLLHFRNVTEPLIDTVAGPLTVLGTPASNFITVSDVPGSGGATAAAARLAVTGTVPTGGVKPLAGIIQPPTFGLVTVDNFLPIAFTHKTALNINGQQGANTVYVNDSHTPTGLAGITIDGGEPMSDDRLIVNAVSATVPVKVAVDTGIITGAAGAGGEVRITYTNVQRLTANMGDTSSLAITGSNDYTFNPAAAADAGTVIVPYTPATAIDDPTLTIDFTGLTADKNLSLTGDGTGRLVVNGTAADDDFVVAPGSGAVTLTTGDVTPPTRAAIVPFGLKVLTLNGRGAGDTFIVSGALPFSTVNLNGGGLADGAIAYVIGNGSNVSATVADGRVIAIYGGMTVTAETGVVNIDALGGQLTVIDDVKAAADVTPTDDSSGTFQAGGTAPRLDYATTGTFIADLTNAAQALVVNDSAPADTLAVSDVAVAMTGRKSVNYKGVRALTVNGLDGNDTYKVTPSSTVAYTLNGGTPDAAQPGNLLTVAAGASPTVFNGGPTGDAGTLVVGKGKPIAFSHMDAFTVTGTTTAAPVTINRTTANEIIDVQAVDATTDPRADGVQDFTVSVNSGPQFLFLDTPNLQVNARGRGDEVTVQEPAPNGADWNMTLAVNGGSLAGNGSVLVQAPAGHTASYAPSAAHGGVLTLKGTAKDSTVTLANVKALTWDGGGDGSVGIVGTAGNNTITVTPGAADDAGVLAVDRLLPITYQDLGTGGLLEGLVRIDGGGGTDTLVVNGTPEADTFRVVSLFNTLVKLNSRGTILAHGVAAVRLVGGAGDDTFNAAGAAIPVTFDGGTGNNTLIGPDAVSTWRITGTNAGTLNGLVSFVHVQNLIGGTGADVFQFANGKGVTGTIDGGDGPNLLDYSAYTTGIRVNLQAGTATGVAGGVTNVQSVVGGLGNDLIVGGPQDGVLTAGSGNSILVGGDGNDVLNAGPGRDVLIGGRGTDVLNAGKGDDLMIAGFTDYDTNVTALLSLMAEWSRKDRTYAQRIDHLKSGGGLNGRYRLELGQTVFGDDAGNTLNGGPGQDWFWATQTGPDKDTLTGKRPDEQVN